MKILYLASIQTCRGGFVFAALCIICCFISVQQAIANQQPQLALQLKHARGIGLAAATTDAQRFVSLGRDAGQRGNDVKEWDIASGLILRSWNAHYGRSFSTALSADGRLVATLNTTLSREGEIRLWDARTGQTLRVLPWQAEVAPIFGQECHLLFSPQGEWLVAIKADWRKIKKISLWNTSSGQLQWSYESKTQYGYQYNGKLKFSPDGSMLAVRAGIRTNDDHDLYTKVEILDVQKGNSRAELKSVDDVIIDDGDFTLDGQAFITRGYIRQKISWEPPPRQWVLTRWDIATGRVLGTIRNIATSYASISVSILPEGETVAVVKGKTIEFWNLLTGKLQRIWKEFDPKATSLSMKLLPDGTMLCIQVYSEKHQVVKTAVQLRDVSTGKVSQRWTRIGYLSLAEFSPDAKYFLSDDGVHRVQDGTRVGPEPGNGLRVPIRAIAFSAQGDKIACALQNEVVIWDIAHGKMQWLRWPTDKTMKFPEVMTSVAFSPDGRWLAAGGGADIEPNPQGVARMWDVATGKFLRVVAQRPEIITDVRFLPDGKTLACSSGRQTEYFSQGEVSLWNVQSGRLDSTLLQKNSSITSLDLSADGNRLVCGSHDGTVEVWHLSNRKKWGTYQPAQWGKAVAITPDGKTLAGVNQNEIPIWWEYTGQRLQNLSGHLSQIISLATSPDGKLLGSAGGHDYTACLWDIENGELKQTLVQHSDVVWDVTFSPSAPVMASAAEDGAVLFWNTSNGKLLATLSIMGSEKGKRDYDRAYVSTQQWIAFTPNGFYDAAPQMKQWIRWRSGDELSTALAYESTLHRPEKLRQLLYMH